MAASAAHAAAPALVCARGVHKWYGAQHVLRGVSLGVARGEVVVLVGPSGSGKTTLLRCLHGLEPIDAGELSVNGEPLGYSRRGGRLRPAGARALARQRREIGTVFQRFHLFAHRTALQNVSEAPLHVLGMPRREAEALAHALLARVGLAHKADSYPAQLSGGQQQRVAIARALAMSPRLLLFDEPTSALDPELTGEVLDVIRELAREGRTMVIASHEMGFAREVADRVLMLDAGEVIEEAAPAEFFGRPAHARTQAFLAKLL
jgi:polar amino acid transport system ATP-binding protein